ncbi:DUF3426 domain-containing protein [Rhodoblastus sp.]|uniref:DUF3426 domain-containing protein n=1 Tax=Rhodoblastus sp. TaxID=1962975 RepID=UPI0025FFBA2F|nr:DUF3426 domain-containing protein [Rhodoblastus sp.]
MRSATSLQPLDVHAFAPRQFGRSGGGSDVGGIAASSSRRALPGAGAPSAPDKQTRALRAPRPWTWVLVFLAAWGLLVGGRAQIVRLAPAAAPLYTALGLGVNLRQMAIEKVTSRLADEDGRQILIVEGGIRNLAEAPRVAPRMRLSVLDATGREIYFWTAAPPKARLAVGETAQFRARLAAPPKEGSDVRVRFAGDADAGQSPGYAR